MPSESGLSIVVQGVTKTYGSVRALADIELEVRNGEFLTLLGPSGSGKTTLLMVLAGFVRPDRGDIRFGGQSVVRMPPHRRNVGVVFQSYALFPHMDVFDNIAFPLRLRGMSQSDAEHRVRQALELVHLGGFERRRIHQLSGGQKQRVALARAIVFEPRVLLMDEPLSALDKQLRERMQVEIRLLHETLGVTTVYVTHDQREALTMSDRIAVINHGALAQVDTPKRLYEQPQSRFVAEFVGESAFLPVDVADGVVHLGGRPLKLAGAPPPHQGGLVLLVRPEKLEMLPPEGGGEDAYNRLTGRVKRTVFQGETFLVVVELEGGAEVAVRDLSRRRSLSTTPKAGELIVLGVHAEDTLLIADER
jgi:putative spermidine/putrescine transport system ATP-binding protein